MTARAHPTYIIQLVDNDALSWLWWRLPMIGARADSSRTESSNSLYRYASFAAAALLSVSFVAFLHPSLATLHFDFDEGWFILDARSILRGLRPFVDFAYHEPPLYLYLLALSGKLFGQTVTGYRMLSLLSIAGSGFALFCLTRPFVGPVPALIAQAVFLSSPPQLYGLCAQPETPMIFFTLIGAVFLFVGPSKCSAYASALAFVVALLIQPTCFLMIVAAVASLVYARAWPRLRALATAGVVASIAGLAWATILSDGIFAEMLRVQLERLGTGHHWIWSVDTGFGDLRRSFGVSTPLQWSLLSLVQLYEVQSLLPLALLVISFVGLPVWAMWCARSHPGVQAFSVLWPASYVILNFLVLDFTSQRYFVPFTAFSSFLIAGLAWMVLRYLPLLLAVPAGIFGSRALALVFAASLTRHLDPLYYRGAAEIVHEHPSIVSFTPMLFAATGTEPGCGFDNPALTYGPFGLIIDIRKHTFRFSDERLIECLKANRDTMVVIDFMFYFFTKPGGPLREYLSGEGSGQAFFLSPGDTLEQHEWFPKGLGRYRLEREAGDQRRP